MRKIPLEFSLFENSYGNDLPIDQYFVISFDSLPSKYSTKALYSKEVITYLISLGFYEECRVVSGRQHIEQTSHSLFIHDTKRIIIDVEEFHDKNPNLVMLRFIYDIKSGELSEQLDLHHFMEYKKIAKKSNIELVRSDMGHLDTEEFNLTIPDYDIELNYGKEFVEINDLIIKRLNTPYDKGIILLYGTHGTGKTTYIKSVTKQIIEKEEIKQLMTS